MRRFGLPTEGHPLMTSERAKQAALTSLAESDRYAEHILNKTWLLFETSAETPFYISDNPVALQNEDKSRDPHANSLRWQPSGGNSENRTLYAAPPRARAVTSGFASW